MQATTEIDNKSVNVIMTPNFFKLDFSPFSKILQFYSIWQSIVKGVMVIEDLLLKIDHWIGFFQFSIPISGIQHMS